MTRRRLTSRGSPAHGAHGLAAARRPPGAAPARGRRHRAPRLLPGPVQVGGRRDAMGRLGKGCTGGYGEGGRCILVPVPLLPSAERSTGTRQRRHGPPGYCSPVPGRVRPGISGRSGGRVPGREAETGPWRRRSRAGSRRGRCLRDLSAWVCADTGNLRARGWVGLRCARRLRSV